MDNPNNPHESDRSADQGAPQEPQHQDVQPSPPNQALLDSLAEFDRKFREGIEVLARFRETLASEVEHLRGNNPVSETEDRLNRALTDVEEKLAKCNLMFVKKFELEKSQGQADAPEADDSQHVPEVAEAPEQIHRDIDKTEPDANPNNGEQAALGLQENNRASSRHDQILPRQSSETVPRKNSVALEVKRNRPWKSMHDLRVLRGMEFSGFLENKEIVPVANTERSSKLNQLLRSSVVAFEKFFKILEDNAKLEFKKKRPWVSMSRLDDPEEIKITFLEEEDEIVVHCDDQSSGSSEYILEEDQAELNAEREKIVSKHQMILKLNMLFDAKKSKQIPKVLDKMKTFIRKGSFETDVEQVYSLRSATEDVEKCGFYLALIHFVQQNDNNSQKPRIAKNFAYAFLFNNNGSENKEADVKEAEIIKQLNAWVELDLKTKVRDYCRIGDKSEPDWRRQLPNKDAYDYDSYDGRNHTKFAFFNERMAFHRNNAYEGDRISAYLEMLYRFMAEHQVTSDVLDLDFNLLTMAREHFDTEAAFEEAEKEFFMCVFKLKLENW